MRIGRASLTSLVMRSTYASSTFASLRLPDPDLSSPRSIRVFSCWMSSPYRVVPATTIFRPLYCGGVWLPPPPTQLPQVGGGPAKYAIGVGALPDTVPLGPAAVGPP